MHKYVNTTCSVCLGLLLCRWFQGWTLLLSRELVGDFSLVMILPAPSILYLSVVLLGDRTLWEFPFHLSKPVLVLHLFISCLGSQVVERSLMKLPHHFSDTHSHSDSWSSGSQDASLLLQGWSQGFLWRHTAQLIRVKLDRYFTNPPKFYHLRKNLQDLLILYLF